MEQLSVGRSQLGCLAKVSKNLAEVVMKFLAPRIRSNECSLPWGVAENDTALAPWGPAALGRGLVVVNCDQIPMAWSHAEVISVTESTVRSSASVVHRLHHAWSTREPVVVILNVDPASFRDPVSYLVEPWQAGARFEPLLDRLHFLVWANNIDLRADEPIWWWSRKAIRLGARATNDNHGDVELPDGGAVWIDGGPRGPLPSEIVAVHRETIECGRLTTIPASRAPSADLADDQLVAVAHGGGPARVIAPAGSGKTRVLTERLRVLLRDRMYEPNTVTAVAYNVKARAEMEERTQDLPSNIRTLNALGLALLNDARGRHTVLDEREVRRIVDELVEVPVSRRKANTDPLAAYVEALSTVRLGLRDPAQVEASRDDVDGFAAMFDSFRSELTKRKALDFDEQIYGAIEVLLSDGVFRQRSQQQFRHLLVDEFQDLTPAHVLLLRLLAIPTLDCFGVGDDDQVIYGHAGADPGFLLNFDQLFPSAANYALEVNYRSAAPIVDAAKTLLSYNQRRVIKDIRPAPGASTTGSAVVVHRVASQTLGSEVVAQVQRWLQAGVAPGDIAVLTRVNAQLLAPQVALAEARIDATHSVFEVILDRAGLRACLAYLRLALSPAKMSSPDIVEILKRPSYGLPPWFADRIRRQKRWSLNDVSAIGSTMTSREVDKLDRLVNNLELLVRIVQKGGHVGELLRCIRDVIGLDAAMELLDNSKRAEGSSHLDDLDALLQVCALEPDPHRFETWLRTALRSPAATSDPATSSVVTLSTIHRVKGREWPCVLLFGVNHGVMPHRLSEDAEEERRVLHVGLTRGRDEVVLLCDAHRPSPMLAELDGTAPRRSPVATEAIASAARLAKPPTSRLTSTPTSAVPDGVAAGDEPVFEALRAWRRQRATKDKVSAFIIVSDKTLKAIVVAKPTSMVSLSQVAGIGPTKLDQYGDEILEALRSVGCGD